MVALEVILLTVIWRRIALQVCALPVGQSVGQVTGLCGESAVQAEHTGGSALVWFALLWWQLLISRSRQFPGFSLVRTGSPWPTAWHKVWVKPQELCDESADLPKGTMGVVIP